MESFSWFTQPNESHADITASSLGVQTASDQIFAAAEATNLTREESKKRLSQAKEPVTAMLTPTERQLQGIAEKMDSINSLRQIQGVAGDVRVKKNQEIARELKAIGQIVTLLPQSFKGRYSEVPWYQIEKWASLNIFVSGFNENGLKYMMSVLDKAEIVIRRHSDPRNELHQGIIMALSTTYEKYSKEWYSYITTPYLLVSLSVIMLIIRIALNDIGFVLTSQQMTAYSIHAVILFLIILEIQIAPKRYDALPPPVDNFSTLVEFFDNQFSIKTEEIRHIRKVLDNRRKLRSIAKTLWAFTLAASIIITWIQN